MKHALLSAISGLSLTGLVACMSPDEGAMPDACGASALQHLIGQPVLALGVVDLPDNVRVIRPGDMVTLDYNPARLNIGVTASGQIEQVTCG